MLVRLRALATGNRSIRFSKTILSKMRENSLCRLVLATFTTHSCERTWVSSLSRTLCSAEKSRKRVVRQWYVWQNERRVLMDDSTGWLLSGVSSSFHAHESLTRLKSNWKNSDRTWGKIYSHWPTHESLLRHVQIRKSND